MKLIIDIADFVYDSVTFGETAYKEHICNAIRNGIPIPDNATNGDVIKIVTSEFYWEIVDEYGNHYMTDVDGNRFDMDWWNASYKRGENNAEQ